jgi:hypothetical protein
LVLRCPCRLPSLLADTRADTSPSPACSTDLTVLLSLVLLAYTIFFYLPQHINFLRRRAAFYALGDESGVLLGSDGVELVARWLRSLGSSDRSATTAASAAGGVDGLGKAAEAVGGLVGSGQAAAEVAATTAEAALRSAAEL